MKKKGIIVVGILIVLVATYLDLQFKGLGYDLLPNPIRTAVDNLLHN